MLFPTALLPPTTKIKNKKALQVRLPPHPCVLGNA
jgi:hypothetical protein